MNDTSNSDHQEQAGTDGKAGITGWFPSFRARMWGGILAVTGYALGGVQNLFPNSPNWLYLLGIGVCGLVLMGTHELVEKLKEQQAQENPSNPGGSGVVGNKDVTQNNPRRMKTAEELGTAPNTQKLGDRFWLEFNGFFGAIRNAEDPISLRVIQMRLVNTSELPLILVSGYWLVGLSERKVPLRLGSRGELTSPDRLEKLPPGEDVMLFCPLSDTPSSVGITLDKFAKDWTPMRLKITLDGEEYDVLWDEAKLAKARVAIERQLAIPEKRPGVEWK